MTYSLAVLALLLSAAIVQATENKCSFVSETGATYDLSPLEPNAPYTFTDASQGNYFVDFCKDSRAGCSGPSAVCLLTKDGTYENLGSPEMVLFSELPRQSGVELTYGSSVTCSNGRTRKTTIMLNCSPERLAVDFIKNPDDCYTIVSMLSQFACPNMNITDDEAMFCAQFSSKDDCFRYSGCSCGWCNDQCVSSKFQDYCDAAGYEYECHARRLTAGMVFLLTVSVLTFMLFGFACCLCCCYKSRRAAHYNQVTLESVEQVPDQEDQDLRKAIELSKVDTQPQPLVEEAAPQDLSQQPMLVYQPLMPQFVSPLQYAQYAHFQFMNANNQQPVQYPFFFQPQVQMPQSEPQDQETK